MIIERGKGGPPLQITIWLARTNGERNYKVKYPLSRMNALVSHAHYGFGYRVKV